MSRSPMFYSQLPELSDVDSIIPLIQTLCSGQGSEFEPLLSFFMDSNDTHLQILLFASFFWSSSGSRHPPILTDILSLGALLDDQAQVCDDRLEEVERRAHAEEDEGDSEGVQYAVYSECNVTCVCRQVLLNYIFVCNKETNVSLLYGRFKQVLRKNKL